MLPVLEKHFIIMKSQGYYYIFLLTLKLQLTAYGVFAGAEPVKVPVKFPAINCPTAPYSVMFTVIGVDIVVLSVSSGAENCIRFCEEPAPILVAEK